MLQEKVATMQQPTEQALQKIHDWMNYAAGNLTEAETALAAEGLSPSSIACSYYQRKIFLVKKPC